MNSPATQAAYQSRAFSGRYTPIVDDDDPWGRMHQANRVELKLAPGPEFTVAIDAEALCVGSGDCHDALQSVNVALAQQPERGDYWMMRFELLRSLQHKAEFGDALRIAWRDPVLVRKLDGRALRLMWRELARWEAPPDGVGLPEEECAGADHAARQLRFNELARRLAAAPLADLRKDYATLRQQPWFCRASTRRTASLLERPTPLQFAVKLSSEAGCRSRVFLKREDGRNVAPYTENAAAQAQLAVMLGRREIIAGNDHDEHSLALATMAGHFGLQCTVVLAEGEAEAKRDLSQQLRNLGVQLRTSQALPMETDDPREGALRLWLERPSVAHLALLTGPGPEPYPTMTADFRAVLGHEAEMQLRTHVGTGRARAFIAARYSKADGIGLMLPQLSHGGVEIFFAEPAALRRTPPPVDALSAFNGAVQLHARLRNSGRATYVAVSDDDAHAARERVFRLEGVRLSLEDARAAAFASVMAASSTDRDIVVLAA